MSADELKQHQQDEADAWRVAFYLFAVLAGLAMVSLALAELAITASAHP